MSEPKDPAIKLFGKTIPLPDISPETAGVCASSGGDDLDRKQDQLLPLSTSSPPDEEENSRDGGGKRHSDKESLGDKATENKQEVSEKEDDTNDKTSVLTSGESRSSEATSRANGDAKTSSTEKGTSIHKTSKTEEDQGETSNSQEKPLKKPSKILPCPRCNSMDTKFCYYNNYNVNQPRHFCKNCQRYWTAGGTMRNVPVGAGRRKNKNSASHCRHITVSEALQNAQTDVPNGLHHHALKANGTVLTFGSDTPLCESMASVLNLADKTMRNCPQNGFQKPELRIAVPYRAVENAGELVNGASLPVANSDDEPIKPGSQDQLVQNCQSFPPQIPYCTGAPWSYPWNSAQWSSPMAPPAFCPPGFPMPFYPPAAFWGCTVPGAWNVPWLPQPSSPKQGRPSSGPNSPTLGKHSRDENTSKPNSSSEEAIKGSGVQKSLWIPKTLRIDDPEEAAKSSIWATLGIKNDKADAASGVGFKAFEPKADQKTKLPEASPVLQANPAAFSRSVNFHESS